MHPSKISAYRFEPSSFTRTARSERTQGPKMCCTNGELGSCAASCVEVMGLYMLVILVFTFFVPQELLLISNLSHL